MNHKERKKLEKDMYDNANEIIGSIGPKVIGKVIDGRVKLTPNLPLALFSIRRNVPDYHEIMNVWTKWIESYCFFTKLDRTPEGRVDTTIDDPDLEVNWLLEPSAKPEGCYEDTIRNHPEDEYWKYWLDGKKPDIENPRFVTINAYLIIHRIDLYSLESNEDITASTSANKV